VIPKTPVPEDAMPRQLNRLERALAAEEEVEPRPSPQTDPTNPFHQEAVGAWTANEQQAERHNDEPGLTDCDRQLRR